MISIAIVEDEELYAKQLQQFLHQYEEEKKRCLTLQSIQTAIRL